MKQLDCFHQLTDEARTNKQPWATAPTCFVGGGIYKWLSVDLASLVIERRTRRRLARTTPEPGKEGKTIMKVSRPLCTLLEDAQMKAQYRLALALWKCGGGALRSALEVLCDAREMSCCTEDDEKQFNALEDRILRYIEQHLKEEEEIEKHVLTSGQPSKANPEPLRFSEPSGTKALIETRYTKIKRELYPWDDYSLTIENLPRQIDDLRRTVARYAIGCQIKAVLSDTGSPRLTPYATRDIRVPDEVCSEYSLFYVTSCLQRKGELFCDTCGSALKPTPEFWCRAKETSQKHDSYTDEIAEHPADQALKARLPLDIEMEETKLTALGIPRRFRKYWVPKSSIGQNGEPTIPLTPPGNHHIPTMVTEYGPKGFQICPDCREVVFCSAKCRSRGLDAFHSESCNRDIELPMRDVVLNHRYRGVPEPNRQRLQSLMLMKILAHVRKRGDHPLEIDWMKLMNGNQDGARSLREDERSRRPSPTFDDDETVDLHTLFSNNELSGENDGNSNTDSVTESTAADVIPKQIVKGGLRRDSTVDSSTHRESYKPAFIPWSFVTNVLQPIRCLFMLGGSRLALDVEHHDGWVLQTLIAKIDATMRITRHPRVRKTCTDWENVFSEERIPLDDESGERVQEWKAEERDLDDSGNKSDEYQVWVGSLHPLASLVRTAVSGEVPNVTMYEYNGSTLCIAAAAVTDSSVAYRADQSNISTHNVDSQPRIRTGEVLIRTAGIGCGLGAYSSSQSHVRFDADRSSFGGDITMNTSDTMLEAAETDYDPEDADSDELAAA